MIQGTVLGSKFLRRFFGRYLIRVNPSNPTDLRGYYGNHFNARLKTLTPHESSVSAGKLVSRSFEMASGVTSLKAVPREISTEPVKGLLDKLIAISTSSSPSRRRKLTTRCSSELWRHSISPNRSAA